MPMIKDNHLGGFVDGGDPRCHYPKMWQELIKDFEIKSVIDIGCGQGQALQYFKEQGVVGVGLDGSEKVLEKAVFDNIIIQDFTKDTYIPGITFDLAWSCEFVEHVEEMYIPNYIRAFQAARFAAFSHALPGQGGYHHVNEQDDEYWIDKFIGYGFIFLPTETHKYRALAHEYFQRSGLVFLNNHFVPKP